MSIEAPARDAVAQLKRAVEQEILEQTNRRVRRLRVEATDRLTVRGCVSSYYLKQLVIQAVLKVLTAEPALPFDLDIEVQAEGRRLRRAEA